MLSFDVEGVSMAGKPDNFEKIEEMINLKFNIQESGKVKKFFGVYYKRGRYAKGAYAKMTMENEVKKLVELH